MGGTRSGVAALAVPALLIIGAPSAAAMAAPSNGPAAAPDTVAVALERLVPPDAVVADARDGTPDVGGPTRAPVDLLTEAVATEDALKPSTYVEAARSALAEFAGIAVPGFLPQGGEGGDPSAGTDRIGLPGGDLTGDGLVDALSLEVTVGQGMFSVIGGALRALRGVDGVELWARDLGADVLGSFPIAGPDLDGDGAGDLLLWQFVVDAVDGGEACPGLVVCVAAHRLQYHWALTALSGPDGSELWSRLYPGEATKGFGVAGTAVTFSYTTAVTATNALVLPILSSDHEGNGGKDVIVDAWDVAAAFGVQDVFAVAAGAFAGSAVALVATRAEVVGGDDGATLLTRESDYRPGGAVLLPGGHTVGDGTGDLLWQESLNLDAPFACGFAADVGGCAGASRSSLALEMIDGRALTAAWESEFVGTDIEFAFSQPFQADLDAAGDDDLLLFEVVSQGSGPVIRQSALAGADGSRLWAEETTAFFEPVGPIGEAPGVDLVGLDFVFGEETGAFGIALERRDGATGELLFRTVHEGRDNGFITAFLGGDADADGVLDLVIERFAFGFEVQSTALIESGAGGGVVYERSARGFAFLVPAGNQDARAGDDAVDVRLDFGRDTLDVTLTGVRLPTGRAAWSRADVLFASSWVALIPTGPQTSGAGADLLYSRSQFQGGGPQLASRIESLDGRRGRVQWSHGDNLAIPPDLGAGAIAGTVTSPAGAPVSGTCISA